MLCSPSILYFIYFAICLFAVVVFLYYFFPISKALMFPCQSNTAQVVMVNEGALKKIKKYMYENI